MLKISGGQAEYRHAECPCGGRKPVGFSSLCDNLSGYCWKRRGGRQNTVMRRLCFPFGRAMPPHDGILPATDDAGLQIKDKR
ncbi:MAG: hypothetical protein LBK61_06110 [Spirochaetaceae bacterium]|nr:hypothetical protein [Spirochaetaceae bacterium]